MMQTLTNTDIARVCVDVLQESIADMPLLVGIVGDSGSGKSFYSHLIQEELAVRDIGFLYLNHDEFLIPRKDREPMKDIFYEEGEFAGKSHWEILENWFRLDVMREVLQTLKAGREVSFSPYARETGEVSLRKKTVSPSSLILVDTSMLLDLMDKLILVDVSTEHILDRKIERDSDLRTPEQVVDMHMNVQGYYWERCKPDTVDILIDNNDMEHPSVKVFSK